MRSALLPAALHASLVFASSLNPPRHVARTDSSFQIPIQRRVTNTIQRRDTTGAIGLGDYVDVTYNVLLAVGETDVPLVLDTGSSDLWVLSDACTTDCFSTDVPKYPTASFQPAGIAVQLLYGDSRTGTHADGPIGKDTASLLDFSLDDQYFAAISSTNASVLRTGSAGIFGLGFPLNSVIWNRMLNSQFPSQQLHTRLIADDNLAIRVFPDFSFLSGSASGLHTRAAPTVSEVLGTFETHGPLIARLVSRNELASPLVTVTLQRDTIDLGGNMGMLTLGALPPAVDKNALTWVGLRGYTVEQGGLPAPTDSPNEVYPLAWEVPIDDVYFDGQKLPRSTLGASNITLSALIDTGNSLIRGPQDVISSILTTLGGNTYPCSEAHTLAFQIGGNLFPIDPRDFGAQAYTNSVQDCLPNVAVTDPPSTSGGFLYSWSLGDPFLKSVLASFYYGNLTYPSQDLPRIGLLSTVPQDAAALLQSVVASAAATPSADFPAITEDAPTSAFGPTSSNALGVPQALVTEPPTDVHTSSAGRSSFFPTVLSAALYVIFLSHIILGWT